MKFGQSMEYNKNKFFFKNHAQNEVSGSSLEAVEPHP